MTATTKANPMKTPTTNTFTMPTPHQKWTDLRESERIQRSDLPHRNSTMRGTHTGKELEYRGREVSA